MSKGVIITAEGQRHTVEYELRAHREVERCPTLEDPGDLIGGPLEIRGSMRPASFSEESQLTLEAEDGQKYQITITYSDAGHSEFVAVTIRKAF